MVKLLKGEHSLRGSSAVVGVGLSRFGDLAGRMVKTAMRQAASQLGRQLARGLMGSLLGKSK